MLLPEIVAALASLNRVSGTAGIRSDLMRLPACLFPTIAGVGLQRVLEQVEVEIDNSDIQALIASLQIVQAAFEFAPAYDLDADLRLVTTQTSQAILDAEPRLLRLRSRAPLTTARNLLDHALQNAGTALDSLLTETDDQSDDLVVILPQGVSDTRLIRDTVKSVRQSLTRSVSLPTELLAEPERLNLSLLFSGRFGTLRPFVPVFDSHGCRTLSSPATLAGTLTHTDHTSLFRGGKTLGAFLPLGRFPDPTFGGTIPDLTQPDITNQFLKWKTCYADCYAFAGTAGQTLFLRVQSATFDTVLTLSGPDGRVVEDNDDCLSDSPNSCLPDDTPGGGRLTLPNSGSYTVEVSSCYAEKGGDYTLTIGR